MAKQITSTLAIVLAVHNWTLSEEAVRKTPKSPPHLIWLIASTAGYDGMFEGVRCFEEREPREIARIGYATNRKQGARPALFESRTEAMGALGKLLEELLEQSLGE